MLTQAREDLIERTARVPGRAPRRATIHMYNATAPLFRRVVFQVDKAECIALATRGTELVMKYAEQHLGDVEFGYQYSPEIFTGTELDFAVEVCNAVMDVWQPGAGREIILNLPATVEMSTPNVYADQIEWFSRHVRNREHVAISLHPHNDRGTADRGHRAGHDGRRRPGRGLPVRPRRAHRQRRPGHPGDEPVLPGHRPARSTSPTSTRSVAPWSTAPTCRSTRATRTRATWSTPPSPAATRTRSRRAWRTWTSGPPSRASASREIAWEAPYLPIDPYDVGRTYEAVIRVNSQSGKGGVAYIMKSEHNLDLPRRLQIEFSRVVQAHTDADGGEVSPSRLWDDLPAGLSGAATRRCSWSRSTPRRRRRADLRA